jgi:hypothetical protein
MHTGQSSAPFPEHIISAASFLRHPGQEGTITPLNDLKREGRGLLPEHQGSGDFIVESLSVGGERDDQEPDEEGENTEVFPEEPEGCPGKGDPVPLHIGYRCPDGHFSERCLVSGALKVGEIDPGDQDEEDNYGEEDLGGYDGIDNLTSGIGPWDMQVVLVEHPDRFRYRIRMPEKPGNNTDNRGSHDIEEQEKDKIDEPAKKSSTQAGKFLRPDGSHPFPGEGTLAVLFQIGSTPLAVFS